MSLFCLTDGQIAHRRAGRSLSGLASLTLLALKGPSKGQQGLQELPCNLCISLQDVDLGLGSCFLCTAKVRVHLGVVHRVVALYS